MVECHRREEWTPSWYHKIASALSRWTLSYNLSMTIASQTAAMLLITADHEDDEYTHKECTKSHMKKDDADENKLVESLRRHGVFEDNSDTLKNIISKDVVTSEIPESLLGAEFLGKEQMRVFVEK